MKSIQVLIDFEDRQFVHVNICPARKTQLKSYAVILGGFLDHRSLARRPFAFAVFYVLFQSLGKRRDAKNRLLSFALILCEHIAFVDVEQRRAHLLLGPSTVRAFARPLRQLDRARLLCARIPLGFVPSFDAALGHAEA